MATTTSKVTTIKAQPRTYSEYYYDLGGGEYYEKKPGETDLTKYSGGGSSSKPKFYGVSPDQLPEPPKQSAEDKEKLERDRIAKEQQEKAKISQEYREKLRYAQEKEKPKLLSEMAGKLEREKQKTSLYKASIGRTSGARINGENINPEQAGILFSAFDVGQISPEGYSRLTPGQQKFFEVSEETTTTTETKNVEIYEKKTGDFWVGGFEIPFTNKRLFGERIPETKIYVREDGMERVAIGEEIKSYENFRVLEAKTTKKSDYFVIDRISKSLGRGVENFAVKTGISESLPYKIGEATGELTFPLIRGTGKLMELNVRKAYTGLYDTENFMKVSRIRDTEIQDASKNIAITALLFTPASPVAYTYFGYQSGKAVIKAVAEPTTRNVVAGAFGLSYFKMKNYEIKDIKLLPNKKERLSVSGKNIDIESIQRVRVLEKPKGLIMRIIKPTRITEIEVLKLSPVRKQPSIPTVTSFKKGTISTDTLRIEKTDILGGKAGAKNPIILEDIRFGKKTIIAQYYKKFGLSSSPSFLSRKQSFSFLKSIGIKGKKATDLLRYSRPVYGESRLVGGSLTIATKKREATFMAGIIKTKYFKLTEGGFSTRNKAPRIESFKAVGMPVKKPEGVYKYLIETKVNNKRTLSLQYLGIKEKTGFTLQNAIAMPKTKTIIGGKVQPGTIYGQAGFTLNLLQKRPRLNKNAYSEIYSLDSGKYKELKGTGAIQTTGFKGGGFPIFQESVTKTSFSMPKIKKSSFKTQKVIAGAESSFVSAGMSGFTFSRAKTITKQKDAQIRATAPRSALKLNTKLENKNLGKTISLPSISMRSKELTREATRMRTRTTIRTAVRERAFLRPQTTMSFTRTTTIRTPRITAFPFKPISFLGGGRSDKKGSNKISSLNKFGGMEEYTPDFTAFNLKLTQKFKSKRDPFRLSTKSLLRPIPIFSKRGGMNG